MQLTTVLTGNQAKAMVPATRRGDTVWLYGSKGDTYRLSPFPHPVTGEVLYTCTCIDYTGSKDGTAFRPSKRETMELCKHGRAVQARALAVV